MTQIVKGAARFHGNTREKEYIEKMGDWGGTVSGVEVKKWSECEEEVELMVMMVVVLMAVTVA